MKFDTACEELGLTIADLAFVKSDYQIRVLCLHTTYSWFIRQAYNTPLYSEVVTAFELLDIAYDAYLAILKTLLPEFYDREGVRDTRDKIHRDVLASIDQMYFQRNFSAITAASNETTTSSMS